MRKHMKYLGSLIVIPSFLAVTTIYAVIYKILIQFNPHSFAGLNQSSHFIDFLYFSIITVTTTGYGDIHPLTNFARIITMTEIVAGFSIILGSIIYGVFNIIKKSQ